MQKNVALIILGLIFFINAIAIITIQFNRSGNNDDKIVVDEIENEIEIDKGKSEEEFGEIGDGLYVDVNAAANDEMDGGNEENYRAIAKSEAIQAEMTLSKHWKAVDYLCGDINTDEWIVRYGDTLWEISEAKYCSGNNWITILSKNSSNIKRLPNGQQALIYPGQILAL